jgi:hypothetical protein
MIHYTHVSQRHRHLALLTFMLRLLLAVILHDFVRSHSLRVRIGEVGSRQRLRVLLFLAIEEPEPAMSTLPHDNAAGACIIRDIPQVT